MPTTSPFPRSTSSLNASEDRSSDTDPLFVIQPQDEVNVLVNRYSNLASLSPAVNAIIQDSSHRRLVYDVLEQHLKLVKTRSQAFEDAHITVYDKALLEITANGTDLYLIGAVQLFADEIVGASGAGNGVSAEEALAKNMALRSLLSFGSRPVVGSPESFRPNARDSAYPNDQRHGAAHKENWSDESRPVAGTQSGNGSWSNDNQETEPANVKEAKDHQATKDSLSRMMETFSRARREYEMATDTDVVAKLHAAKFLRDTAENVLNYLHFWKIEDHPMVPELQVSLETARNKAIELSGGRKRHFEMEGAPTGPRNRCPPSRGFSNTYRGRGHQAYPYHHAFAENPGYHDRKYDSTRRYHGQGHYYQKYDRREGHY